MTHHPSVEELGNAIRQMAGPCSEREAKPRKHCDKACGFEELLRKSALVCTAKQRMEQLYRKREGVLLNGGGCEVSRSEFKEENAMKDPQCVTDCYNKSAAVPKMLNVLSQAVHADYPGRTEKPPHYNVNAPYYTDGRDPHYNTISQKIKVWIPPRGCAQYDYERFSGAHYNALGQKVEPCFRVSHVGAPDDCGPRVKVSHVGAPDERHPRITVPHVGAHGECHPHITVLGQEVVPVEVHKPSNKKRSCAEILKEEHSILGNMKVVI